MSTMHRPSFTKTLTALLPGGILPHLLLLLCSVTATFPAMAQAADFAGDLDQVKITDAAGTNQPPVAAFTFSQNGETYTFDASGSTDPDGSIATYKWTYPDGTTAEGATATFTTAETAKFPVTLTVIDNNGGAALNQQQVVPTAKGIADDFSTDTTSNYAVLSGSLNIYDGYAHGIPWKTNNFLHKTAIGNGNHTVEANIYNSGGTASAGLIARGDISNQTWIAVFFESGKIVLKSVNAGKETWIATGSGSYAQGVYHLRVNVLNNSLSAYVNGSLVIETTFANIPAGNHIGIRIRTGSDADIVTLDNLKGDQ